ncbi:glycosyl transferase family 39 [Rhodomicrobium vannielii ATCC 17100]|uniref:Glycosyl transferase family 39 n=2 Tax=Rhodomicrobium vannielii TaxID=1069 RepID=E3I809_RHOVT|nr:glycosyl transferase family 39 [Rhodomicrobium vannielii ATCC 17100]
MVSVEEAAFREKANPSSRPLGGNVAGGNLALTLGLIAVAGLLIARFVLAATTELAEDEAYYCMWSKHLAAGYYDHPAMIAWWIRAGTEIFGDTAFGVRFVGLLSTVAGSYLLWRASLALFADRAAALFAVVWMNATILSAAAGIVATPDTPLAFFATCVLFAIAKLVETGRGAWWLAIGAALGLAFMSKYTATLLLPGLFLWMVGTREGRRWFLRPEPYLGAVIALVAIAPVVWWNYVHDWASFAKQAAHGVKDKPANAIASIGELLGGQAGLATPLIFLFCLWGSFYALARGLRRGDARWLLLGGIAAPMWAFFIVHAASQKIQPNWPGLVYPFAILAAVHGGLAVLGHRRAPVLRVAFIAAPFVGVAFTLVALLQLGTGAIPIEGKKDPTARMKGWATLGVDIDRLRREHGAGLVLTDRYAITGELAFYGMGAEGVAQINDRIRYANFPPPDEARLKDAPALLVLKAGSQAKTSLPFDSAVQIGTVTRPGGLRPRDAYAVFLLSGYRGGLFACNPTTKRGETCSQM